MENMGTVNNFIEMGQILFPDTSFNYSIDDGIIEFILEKEIDGIKYTAERQYGLHYGKRVIMLENNVDDIYFEKNKFRYDKVGGITY